MANNYSYKEELRTSDFFPVLGLFEYRRRNNCSAPNSESYQDTVKLNKRILMGYNCALGILGILTGLELLLN